MNTLLVGQTSYQVEKKDAGRLAEIDGASVDRSYYVLHGRRGAVYGAYRAVDDPTMLFVMNAGGKMVDRIGWLTDRRGCLELA